MGLFLVRVQGPVLALVLVGLEMGLVLLGQGQDQGQVQDLVQDLVQGQELGLEMGLV